MGTLLETKNLQIVYKNVSNNNSSIVAVDDVSIKIQEGEIYALAGESGCGKSTLAKAITKLVYPSNGEILFENKNIFKQSKIDSKKYPQKVQMVFQNPYSSLNPKMKIMDTLKEPLDINTKLAKSEKESIIEEVLSDTGLSTKCLSLYPHEFSGGQRQRIAIARALVLQPQLLIADEPVSALDASIQAQIINLLKELKIKKNLTMIFISHDMNVIQYLADRIGVMKFGKLVEENYSNLIFNHPKSDYTKQLISSIPRLKV